MVTTAATRRSKVQVCRSLATMRRQTGSRRSILRLGARYYGSALGRFSSPDPESASASLFHPQLWNAYSYAINNPLAYRDPDGRNPLLVTAAVGAGVGALVGGGFELVTQLSRNGGSLDDLSWSKVGTAALGGGVAGGVAGLTLGLGTAAGVTLGLGQNVAINAGANIIGGEVQRQADAALGNGSAPTGLNEAAAIGIDAVAGGAGGLIGGRIADKIYPLPNVKKEIELLKFANRRSTRTARIEAFKSATDQQAARNAVSSGVQGGARTSTYTGWLQMFWNGLTQPTKSEPKACVSVSDSASGSNFGGCK